MGVLYSVFPFDTYHREGNFLEFLAEFGIEVESEVVSRNPSASEIRLVLDEMPAFTKIFYTGATVWDVSIYETALYDQEQKCSYGKTATIYSINPSVDESFPIHIYFKGGSEEVNLEIVWRLTKFTGPLVFLADYDAVPILVDKTMSLDEVLSCWMKKSE